MVRVFAAAAVLSFALGAFAVELALQPKVMTEAGEFHFEIDRIGEVNEFPFDPNGDDVVRGATPTYLVLASLADVRKKKFDQFGYDLYVRAKSGGPITRFVALGAPIGSFEDRMAAVEFTVGDGALQETKTIRLPIFGSQPRDALSADTSKPVDVFLASESPVRLAVKNELTEMPVAIVRIHPPVPGDASLWQPAKVQAAATDSLDPGARAELAQLLLQPKVLPALASALMPAESAQSDTLKVSVDYRTVGRTPRTLMVEIPVRFKPWPPLLLIMTVAGALLGSLVPATSRKRKWSDWWRAFSTAAVVAVFVELFSMVLKINHSDVRLLNIDLDPFQLPTATLIGVIVGMAGYRSLDRFRELMDAFWKRGRSADANP